jgi:elongation factor Ts
MHNAIAPGLGKIGVLVGLESSGDKDKLAELGRKIAMHVAAANPLALTQDDVDATTVERERAVLIEQAKEAGKPDNIIEKMVEGRLRKFFEESVLLKQTFVIDGENTVEAVLKSAEADIGAPVAVAGFLAYRLGEGIAREESDFAAEVAAAAGH